jgi:hypothetical protein
MNLLTLSRIALIAGPFFLLPPRLSAQDFVFKGNGPHASLIELYSSEGCCSCPPAETWLNDLKTAPGLWKEIFPVAFHVDYWDGNGWPDRFARAGFTQRQRDYATRLGQDSVYTPEFIVNGREWRRGWIDDRLPDQATTGELVVTVAAKDAGISARYSATAPGEGLMVNVALLGFNAVTDVKRGENGGRTLRHDFVVLGFLSTAFVHSDDGALTAGPGKIENTTGEKPGAVVAWVSRPDGAILQLAGGWLRDAAKAPAQATSAAPLLNP